MNPSTSPPYKFSTLAHPPRNLPAFPADNPSTSTQPQQRKSSSWGMLVSLGLILILSARLLGNNIHWNALPPSELEVKLMELNDQGKDEEALKLVQEHLKFIPSFEKAAEIYREQPRGKFLAYMQDNRATMRRHQEIAYTCLQYFRRYQGPDMFASFFAVVSEMDPETEIAKEADLLRRVEQSVRSKELTQEETDRLYEELHQLAREKEHSQLFQITAGVIFSNHDRSSDAIGYYERFLPDWKVGTKLLRRDYGDLLESEFRHYDAMVYRKATIEHFPTAAEYSNLASSYARLNRIEDAVATFKIAVELDPKEKIVWKTQARSMLLLGQFEDVIFAAKKLTELDKSAKVGWGDWAYALEGLERPEEAVAILREGLSHASPDDPWYLERLSYLRAFDSEHPAFHKEKGTLYKQTKSLTSQVEFEKRIVQLYASGNCMEAGRISRDVFNKLHAFRQLLRYAKQGDQVGYTSLINSSSDQLKKECEFAFFHALEERSVFERNDSVLMFKVIGSLVPRTKLGEISQIIAELDNSVTNKGSLTEDEVEDCLERLRRSVSGEHVSPFQLWLGGIICRSLKRPQEGVEYYERLEDYWMHGPVLMHQTHANHLDQLNRHSEALRLRYRALALLPGTWVIRATGNTYANLFRYEDAVDSMRQALQKDPNNSGLRSSLGYNLMRCGKFDEAIKQLKIAISLDQTESDAWRYWADCLCSQDRPDEAYRIIYLAKTINPEVPSIERALARLEKHRPATGLELTLEEVLAETHR